MRKHILSLKGFLASGLILFLFPAMLYAFQADLNVWKSVYPNSTLGNSLSCNLCHGSSSKSQANATSYGKAVWGTSPISSAAIKAAEGLDSDGDGATNLTEINANTNPNDPNSKPGDNPPVAKITVSKTTFTVGETATFSGSTSADDKGITKYEWDFTSNGSIDATGVTASTFYSSAGSYNVTLKVTDTIGQTGSVSVNITVNAAADNPPLAQIAASKTVVNIGETVSLSGSTSTDDKGITKYEWDFTSNGSIDATGVTASTFYSSAGSYNVTLKVTDTIGQTGSASINITVNAAADAPPVAKITVSKTIVNIGEIVSLSGSTSTDDKGITKYEWDFTSNGSIDATGVTASTSYSSAGSYNVTLKVTDTIGQTGSASVAITVTATPPPADKPPIAKITAIKTFINIGETVNFSGFGSSDDKGITKYEWDFTSNGSIDAAGATASTSYSSAGSYKATLKVTDTIGQTGTASVNIIVKSSGGDDDKKKKDDDDKKKKDDDDKKKKEEEEKKKKKR